MEGREWPLSRCFARATGASELVARVRVDPDYHYRGVFEGLLATLTDSEALATIREAGRRTTLSAYVLEEIRLPLGAGESEEP